MGNKQSENKKKEPGFLEKVSNAYQQVVNAIIRPPRCIYELSQLGPSTFRFGKTLFQRKDFILTNPRGLNFHCSHWEPVYRTHEQMPCVVYMHGNSSARLESLGQLALVLSIGATFFAFDFCGSGKSDGEYVSLGYFEKDDLQEVVRHLRESGQTSELAFWGRSMGAATALLHSSRDPSINGMILDSSFTDLQLLAEELIETGRQQGLFAPDFAVSLGIYMIRNSVLSTAHFDIRHISPLTHAPDCLIPALFIAGAGDKFIPPSHSERLHAVYGGGGGLILVDGDHNSVRPKTLGDQVTVFLRAVFRLPATKDASIDTSHFHGRLPWHPPVGAPAAASTSPSPVPSPSKARRSVEDRSADGLIPSSPSSSSSYSYVNPKSPSSRTPSPSIEENLVNDLGLGSREGGGVTRAAVGDDPSAQTQLDFGMTQQRQNEIRSNLFSMLGSGGAGSPAPPQPPSSLSSSKPLK